MVAARASAMAFKPLPSNAGRRRKNLPHQMRESRRQSADLHIAVFAVVMGRPPVSPPTEAQPPLPQNFPSPTSRHPRLLLHQALHRPLPLSSWDRLSAAPLGAWLASPRKDGDPAIPPGGPVTCYGSRRRHPLSVERLEFDRAKRPPLRPRPAVARPPPADLIGCHVVAVAPSFAVGVLGRPGRCYHIAIFAAIDRLLVTSTRS